MPGGYRQIMAFTPLIRPAVIEDAIAIKKLLSYNDRIHRHLDWCTPMERLGEPSYYVIDHHETVQAAMSCPEDPQDVAWVRFFGAQPGYSMNDSFSLLLREICRNYTHIPEMIVSVAVQGWFLRLLMEQQFTLHQVIVVLQLDPFSASLPDVDPQLEIRPVTPADLDEVVRVDYEAFAPIWRYSQHDIRSAFSHSAYATIAMHQNQVVGYQFSSATPFSAHLTRLAVIPSLQGHGIGRQLTADMIRYTMRNGIDTITVNTQSDNHSSLKVYQRIGFMLTGEQFPVMRYEGHSSAA